MRPWRKIAILSPSRYLIRWISEVWFVARQSQSASGHDVESFREIAVMTDEPMFGHLDAGSLRRLIQEEDDAKFDQRLARLQRVRLHKIIPHLWFDVASTECRDLFRDGHFYGCVCLTQSVAEALAKFVLEVHKEKIGKQRRPIELVRSR